MGKVEQLGSYNDYKDLLPVEISESEAIALYTRALGEFSDQIRFSRREDDNSLERARPDNRFFESHGHDLAEEAHA